MIKNMRKFGIISFVLLASLRIVADDSIVIEVPRANLLQEMTRAEVIQDSVLALLLDGAMNGKHEIIEVDGYRVQVYSSNQQQTAKAEALNLEVKLKEKVNQSIYVQYLPPFWKVRLGDFRTYDEAREYKKLFVQIFPSMMGDTYIVRDKIQVLQQ